jgi:hypothetical protein
MHGSAVIGYEDIAPLQRAGKLFEVYLPRDTDSNAAGKLLDPGDDPVVLRAAEEKDFARVPPLQMADQLRVPLSRPSFGRPDRAGIQTEDKSIALDAERLENPLHALSRPRIRLDTEIPLALFGIDPERLENRQVPFYVVTRRIPFDPTVVKKPSFTLAKTDPIGNPCEKEKKRRTERFMRREGDGKTSLAQFFDRAPKPSPAPAALSLVVYDDFVQIRVALQETLCLGGAENGQFGFWKATLNFGEQGCSQNHIAEETGLNHQDFFSGACSCSWLVARFHRTRFTSNGHDHNLIASSINIIGMSSLMGYSRRHALQTRPSPD